MPPFLRVCQGGSVSIVLSAYGYRSAFSPSSYSFLLLAGKFRLVDSSRLSSQREVAIVLFLCDRSQHIPSQGTAHVSFARGSAWSWQMLICLVRIPHRMGHSIQRDVRLVGIGVRSSHRINGCIRVGPNGRDLESLFATRIEQPSPNPTWFASFPFEEQSRGLEFL